MLYQIADLESAKRFSGYDTDQEPDVISSQQCTIWAPMWAVKDGIAESVEMNAKYMDDYKNNKEFKVDTGFRIWKRSTKTEYLYAADGGAATLRLTDWSEKIDYEAARQAVIDSGSSSSGGMSGGSSSEGMKDGDDMMMDDEEGGSMMMIVIIVVAVAVVLIIGVIVGFVVMRSKNNKKTEIQLKEGGEVEMDSIAEE